MMLESKQGSRADQVKSLLSNVCKKSTPATANVVSAKKAYGFSQEFDGLDKTMIEIDKCGIKSPFFRASSSVSSSEITINNEIFINFSGYNYLGYSGDTRVNAAAKKAIDQFGTSPSASRLVSGEKTVHVELEAEIAQFLDCADCLVLSSGHATNVTVIGHLFNSDDLILYDELSHNSLIEGAVLSGARRIAFKHNDFNDCESLIRRNSKHYNRTVILMEGVYSTDGDIAPVDGFVRLKNKYKALLYVDEAHSLGTIGNSGGGAREHFGLTGRDVDLWMGTLSKSLASNGGYIAGSRELIKYLKYTTPGFVFAAGITPANAAASLAALKLLKEEPFRVKKLRDNFTYLHNQLKKFNYNLGPSDGTPIIPLIVGDSKKALKLSDALYQRNIISHPLFYPTVPEGEARLRFFVTYDHTEEQLDYVVRSIQDSLRAIG